MNGGIGEVEYFGRDKTGYLTKYLLYRMVLLSEFGEDGNRLEKNCLYMVSSFL